MSTSFELEGNAPVIPEPILATPEQLGLIVAYKLRRDEIKKLEAELNLIESDLIKLFEAAKISSVRGDFGIVTKYERGTWKYSDEVKLEAENLKAMKQIEEETGIATKKITTHIKVTDK